ncbi:MAG TPA: AmmeMemoRadiSam system protein B [Gammaproteobacteria bacterium]|nr:AmmeMemoRadiSam system protein B [Gammaproteobacteria bacterium]
MTVRPPAVAGTFYPADPQALRAQVAQLLRANGKSIALRPKAIIAPHAGYVYSGPVAASVYNLLRGATGIERVLLIGPAHRAFVRGLALPAAEEFVTPLGKIPLDLEALEKLKALPQVAVSEAAHAFEHSLEVQLPFLQSVLPPFRLVPLVVGDAAPETVAQVIDAVWTDDTTLPVISSDLSHFLDYAQARAMDAATGEAILEGADDLAPDQACGCMAINGLMRSLARRALKVSLVDMRNSGDTAGSRDRVVGYASYVIH